MSALRNFFSRYKRGPLVHPFPAPRHDLEGAEIEKLDSIYLDDDGQLAVKVLVRFPPLPYGKPDGTVGIDHPFCDPRTLTWDEFQDLLPVID